MTKETSSQGEFDKGLAQYPDLARAREIFIDLLQDKLPLIKLGYTGKQIEFALPVLRLLEDEGEVATHIRNNPYLYFSNPNDPWAEALQVYRLPKRQGFYLWAIRDETARGWGNLSKTERFKRILQAKQPVVIFQDLPEQVAHIGLFEEGADINNLDYLVRRLIIDVLITNAPLGIRAENPVTKFARAVGATATYEAAWVDPQTQLEFVAKVDLPRGKKPDPVQSVCVGYRKLVPPLRNYMGKTMTVIGKVPNTSDEKVTKVLSTHFQKYISGEFALSKVRA